MIVVSAQMVEQAYGNLNDQDYTAENQVHMAEQMAEIISALPTKDFLVQAGVVIGIQAARIFLAGNPVAIEGKLNF